jgi:hypothetical protein
MKNSADDQLDYANLMRWNLVTHLRTLPAIPIKPSGLSSAEKLQA